MTNVLSNKGLHFTGTGTKELLKAKALTQKLYCLRHFQSPGKNKENSKTQINKIFRDSRSCRTQGIIIGFSDKVSCF